MHHGDAGGGREVALHELRKKRVQVELQEPEARRPRRGRTAGPRRDQHRRDLRQKGSGKRSVAEQQMLAQRCERGRPFDVDQLSLFDALQRQRLAIDDVARRDERIVVADEELVELSLEIIDEAARGEVEIRAHLLPFRVGDAVDPAVLQRREHAQPGEEQDEDQHEQCGLAARGHARRV